ncbi:MAG: hypothetical protein F4Y35_03865 [Chloroflexi bacterium]|nr:hypothetical protein [Chloroflexota bacterium]
MLVGRWRTRPATGVIRTERGLELRPSPGLVGNRAIAAGRAVSRLAGDGDRARRAGAGLDAARSAQAGPEAHARPDRRLAWIRADHLAALLGVARHRVSKLTAELERLKLIASPRIEGKRRFVLSDRGLALLARRDRASVGAARNRWSADPLDPEEPLRWRNLRGRRTRQLLRNLTHSEAVHGFSAALADQAHATDWRVTQLDPPQRASRYFRFDDRLHSIQPDAFGVLRREVREQPFFLEWERRAIRPSTMAAKLAPYLRY